jgi:hypothetical protein
MICAALGDIPIVAFSVTVKYPIAGSTPNTGVLSLFLED